MAVSLKDIAAVAGVSDAAVSMALRDHPRISEKRRKQIKALALEMGYRPNLLARALAEGKTYNIALLASAFHIEVAMMKIMRLDELATARGYRITLSYTKSEPERCLARAQEFAGHGVDGMIVYGLSPSRNNHESMDLMQAMTTLGKPVVFLDCMLDFPCRQVYSAKGAGITDAVRRLYALGHRSTCLFSTVAFLGMAGTLPEGRMMCFDRTTAELGMERCGNDGFWPIMDDDATINGIYKPSFDPDVFYEKLLDFLRRFPQCTSILCTNDVIGAFVIRSLERMGLRVPDDMSVVGFDNSSLAVACYPSLASVAHPIEKITTTAFNMLMDSIENGNDKPETIVVPSIFHEQPSIATVRSGDLAIPAA